MSETIQFHATADGAHAGEDEMRLVLALSDSASDLAAATSMIAKRNRVLHISAYIEPDLDAPVEFRGAIAQIKTGLEFRGNRPPRIRLDIPASDAIKAARLVGYGEQMIRFEIADDGERPAKVRKARPKAKTPFGDMWQELLHRSMGFEHIPVVAAALESVRSSPHEDAHLLMRKLFGVESLSKLIGPNEIHDRFPHTAVMGMVRQACAEVEKRQAKAPGDGNEPTKTVYLAEIDDFPPEWEGSYGPPDDPNSFLGTV